MLDKRAQSEDFFGDLLPAVVVIVIALFVGSTLSASHSLDVEEAVLSSGAKFNGIDIFAFLHTPIGNYSDMAEFLTVMADSYENGNMEFFSGEYALFGAEYAECSEEFRDVAGEIFEGSQWIVSVFEVVDMESFPQKKVFECNNLGVGGLESNGIRFSETYIPSSGFVAYRVVVGWKDG